jgi:hypothetical protein
MSRIGFAQVRKLLGMGSLGQDPKPARPGKRSSARAGGGSQKMRVSKHAAINRGPAFQKAYQGRRRNLSARKKRRLRYLASLAE